MKKVLSFIALFFLSISLVQASRMPTIGGDNESWGTILNDFLNVSLNDGGYLENDVVGTDHIINHTITDADISDSAGINASKLSGLASIISLQNFSAANIISGILSAARGGTGLASYVVGDILYANSTSTLNSLGIGNATQVLIGGITPNWSSLTSSMFSAGVILSNAIANRNITADKVAPGAINATHLAAGAISGTNLAAGTVNGTHISNASITTNHLAANSVNTTHIIDGTITDADISPTAAINASKISGLSSITSASNITSGVLGVAYGGTNISSYTTGDLIYANSSEALARLPIGTAAQILIGGTIPTWGALTTSMIGAGIINTTHLANNIITADKIAAGIINSTHLGNNIITADKIAPGAINATHLAPGAVSASVNLTTGSVNSTHILDGTIVAIDIAAGAINSSHLVSNTIQGSNINTNANLTVGSITVGTLNVTGNVSIGGVIDLSLQTVTDDCSGVGCTSTATCPAGKRIIIGFTGSASGSCDTSPSACNGYCTTGATSCAVTEDDLVVNVASVRIVCGRI